MKSSACINDARAAGMSAGELDGGFHSFAAGAAEKSLRQAAARPGAQFRGQLPGQIANLALEHGWTMPVQFFVERGQDFRMVVSGVVDAIARKKIDDPAPILRI